MITEIPVRPSDDVRAALAGKNAAPGHGTPRRVPDVLTQAPDQAARPGAAAELDTVDAHDRVAAAPVQSASPFQTVAVTWPKGTRTAPRLQARVRSVDGRWGQWFDLEVEADSADAGTAEAAREKRAGTEAVHVGDADAVQVATAGDAADTVAVDDVKVALIGSPLPADPAGAATADPAVYHPSAQAGAVQSGRTARATIQQAAVSKPDMVTRAQWGAVAPTCTLDSVATLKAGVVHHTADPNDYATQAQAMQQIRNDQAYHMNTRGWCDLGYNFVVDKWGTLYEGRAGSMDSNVIGVHAGGFNTGTVGVAVLGTYTSVAFPQAAVNTVGVILGWKLGRSNVSPGGWMTYTTGGGENSRYAAGTTVKLPRIFGHRDTAYTECPGNTGYTQLDAIRAVAAAHRAAPANSLPIGVVDAVTQVNPTTVHVAGWAIDADAEPINVHVYVDGHLAVGWIANGPRSDIARIYGRKTSAFAGNVTVTTAKHQVCVYAINSPAGGNPSIGCKTINVVNHLPIGHVDALTVSAGHVTVRGWALDPDTTASIPVHVYVDGHLTTAGAAKGNRPDVGRAFGLGSAHGYSLTFAASSGRHDVCVWAINTPAGGNPKIGCGTVTV